MRAAKRKTGKSAKIAQAKRGSRAAGVYRALRRAIIEQAVQPGQKLPEDSIGRQFGVSRTLVREALMQLQARGFVEVRARRGWYVVEPSFEQARDAFAARRAVEAGLLREAEGTGRPLQAVVRRLRSHLQEERAAVQGADTATRALLLAEFHVCLAECLGHKVLADMLRDLTARTTLAATLYQSTHEAQQSNAQHAQIVAAIERAQWQRAAELMTAHIGDVEAALGDAARPDDPRERLRKTLAPMKAKPPATH